MRSMLRLGTYIIVFLFPFLVGSPTLQAQDSVATQTTAATQGNYEEGKALFQQCAACHAIVGQRVGPQLKDTHKKYAGDEAWLYSWIKNAPKLYNEGDPKALALVEQYGPSLMQAFPTLQDAQIASIMEYVKVESELIDNPPAPEGGNQIAVAGGGTSLDDPTIYYSLLALVAVLALIALLLVVITATLVSAVRAKEQKEAFSFGDVMARTRQILSNKFVIASIGTIIAIGTTVKLIAEARTIGLHQGYMPEQPIAFSHKLHAGEYEIDCKYCHTGTTKSKSAWIPSVNVCMNCHKAIRNRSAVENRHANAKGDNDISPEIMKIYQAAGWDPEAFAYNGEEKAIEWVRIHNNPDHAYFNHAQHVVVGNIECQTCHGPVENMEVVYQYADLGMGWCINCHRNEKVKVKGEPTEHTVEDMGGLDCARCHY